MCPRLCSVLVHERVQATIYSTSSLPHAVIISFYAVMITFNLNVTRQAITDGGLKVIGSFKLFNSRAYVTKAGITHETKG